VRVEREESKPRNKGKRIIVSNIRREREYYGGKEAGRRLY